MGELQFRFPVEHGLRPQHVLVDVACGSLRAGVRLIPYLEVGNYLGLDIKEDLVRHGVDVELGRAMYEIKKPEFVIDGNFDFEKFSKRPDFAIAQSLFSHLIAEDVRRCLAQLRQVAKPGTTFFATIFEGESSQNAAASHPHGMFQFSRGEFDGFAQETGWNLTYIGEWEHPRGQKMLQFTPAK